MHRRPRSQTDPPRGDRLGRPGLHLTVGAFQRLKPQGVLPVVIAVPLGVTLLLLVLVRLGLRRLERGAPTPG